MAWQLKWGEHVKALERQSRKTGRQLPALRNRPKLPLTDSPFVDAFYALHAARTFGAAAPNPLAVHEVAAYLSLRGIASSGEKSKYLRLIQQLDGVYLSHWAEKNPSPGSTPSKRAKHNNKS